MSFVYYLVIVLFVFISFLLCFVILMQESKSIGLGASFGGDSGDSVFGTATADVLKDFTSYLAVIFMVFCIILSLWTARLGRSSENQKRSIEIEEVN